MRTNAAGIFLTKYFEKFVPYPYLCPAMVWTIAYGHVIRPGESFTTLTEPEGEALLMRDLLYYEASVARLIRVPLTENQFSALTSFAFNLGSGALQASTLRSMLNRGEFRGAADQFDRWVFCRGQKLRGLVLRRAAERKLFLTP